MGGMLGFISRNWKSSHPPQSPKNAGTLRFGILGAAKIG